MTSRSEAEPARRPAAVFLDRDGVINRKTPEGEYVTRWRKFEFLPTALEALSLFAREGIPVIVVTNQRGIALGRMTEAHLQTIHERMLAAVTEAGGRIAAVYHCPHAAGCKCRKPAPGMLQRAAADLELDLASTAMVGDRAHDMAAAAAVGALRVLVGNAEAEPPEVDHVASDLLAATRWLLGLPTRGSGRPRRSAAHGRPLIWRRRARRA